MSATAKVNSWYEFVALIESDFMDWAEYIFRGQKDSRWSLRSRFDREYRNAEQLLSATNPLEGLSLAERSLVEESNPKMKMDSRDDLLDRMLQRFKKACTGRRGQSPKSLSDTEWWTLGQHFGLATPLLDWTRSPYVAAYFALKESAPEDVNYRAVWAYSHDSLMEIFINSNCFMENELGASESVNLVEGLVDENARIVSQGGLFTMTPSGQDLEEYIENSINLTGMSPVLYKIEIPSSLREVFLRHLESMNINHGSLFPDISGAAEYANRGLEKESTDLLWKAKPAFIRRMLSNDSYHGDQPT